MISGIGLAWSRMVTESRINAHASSRAWAPNHPGQHHWIHFDKLTQPYAMVRVDIDFKV